MWKETTSPTDARKSFQHPLQNYLNPCHAPPGPEARGGKDLLPDAAPDVEEGACPRRGEAVVSVLFLVVGKGVRGGGAFSWWLVEGMDDMYVCIWMKCCP